MRCERSETVLHAYLDGETDAAGSMEFERHADSCDDCSAVLKERRRLRSAIQGAGLYARAPEALSRKLRAEFGAPAKPAPAAVDRATTWRWLAVAASLFLVAIVGWQLRPGASGSQGGSQMASLVVDAHLRSLQPGHLTDVLSTDQHTVKPWFDGKVDFAPPVQDFASDGFPLQGGRLDAVNGRTVAALVYGRRKHVVNVFVWPTAGADAPASSGSLVGYHWIAWRAGGMQAYAVSDVNAGDLAELQKLWIRPAR